jgi:hypothetical protein
VSTTKVNARSDRGQTKIKPWVIGRALISLAILIAILQNVETESVVKLVLSVKMGWLLAAAAVAFLGRIFAAFRWYILLRGRNAHVTFYRVLNIVLISSFFGMLLPGAIGVELLRVYGMSKATADTALALSSVLVERLLAILVLTLFSIGGLYLVTVELPAQLYLAVWTWLLLLLLMIVLLLHSLPRTLIDKLLERPLLSRVRPPFTKLVRALDDYRAQPKLLMISLLAALLAALFRIVPTVLIARSLDINISIVYFAIFLPIVHLVVQIPISLGGLGVRETGFVFFMGLIGVSSENAFTLSIVVYALTLATALPGAWLYARQGLIVSHSQSVSSASMAPKGTEGRPKSEKF